MSENNNNFKHRSLQDVKGLQEILKALTKGLGKGSLVLGDEDGKIELKPDGLMNLKVSASQEDSLNQLDIKISWQAKDKELKKKTLSVK